MKQCESDLDIENLSFQFASFSVDVCHIRDSKLCNLFQRLREKTDSLSRRHSRIKSTAGLKPLSEFEAAQRVFVEVNLIAIILVF
jgi:hypothetical protein